MFWHQKDNFSLHNLDSIMKYVVIRQNNSRGEIKDAPFSCQSFFSLEFDDVICRWSLKQISCFDLDPVPLNWDIHCKIKKQKYGLVPERGCFITTMAGFIT